METVTIKLTNGKKKKVDKGITYYELSKLFGLDENILGVKINNELFNLHDKVLEDNTIEFVDLNDLVGNKIYKSGLEFLFQVALKKVYPDLDIVYQHSVPKGVLGEIDGDKIINQEDLIKIKSVMAKMISDNIQFKKYNIKRKDAITFYRNNDELEKCDNVQNISDKIICLYELKGYYNYFYSEMPYSTGSIKNYDIVYLGRNRLVFLVPSHITGGVLPEYVHYDNIINSFLSGKNWLETLGMPYVTNLNKTVCDGSINKFIRSCELVFNLNVSRVCENITNNRNIKFVLIAGPSSSGKTTTTKRMSSYLMAQGFDPINISTDDYYLDREKAPKDDKGNYDFECLSAIDLDLFNSDLNKLLDGYEIDMPSYNFISGRKEFNNNIVKMKENSIILIEGLHAINDELLPRIENKYKYKIYLSPFIPLNIDRHNYVSTLDLRLMRRIIRDNRTRGYKVDRTIANWQNVRNGEEKYIFPFIHQADIIINTALPYEIGVERTYIEPLLRSVSIDSNYYEEARRLLNFLKIFYTIPSEFVPDDSILREFIGGNYD